MCLPYFNQSGQTTAMHNLADGDDHHTVPHAMIYMAQGGAVAGLVRPPSPDSVKQAPWKYAGYPQFTRFVASDQAWLVTRRFGTINARIILFLQDKVVKLEDDLNQLDRDYSQPATAMQDDDQAHNGSFRLESFADRTKLMGKLMKAVKQYNSFVNDYSKLAAQPGARPEDVEAIRIWMYNNEYAINDPEAAYIDRKFSDDLFAVVPKPRSWFRTVLEATGALKHRPLRWILSREPCDEQIRAKEGDTVWHNDKRVETFSAFVIGILGLGMLIGPIWVVYRVDDSTTRLAIISGFIVLFYILVRIATTAKVFESLAAVAAYAAILMVFMQISPSGTSSGVSVGAAGG